MSETHLREAFALMKQGNKSEALKLVQTVLREDRSNVYGWWLLANLLDDEDKVVKSLEKVLSLNPEHPGARKRLAELRPEYAHLIKPDAEPVAKAKNPETTDDYWDRVTAKAKNAEPNPSKLTKKDQQVLIAGAGLIFLIVVACVFFNSLGITFSEMAEEAEAEADSDILARMENNPESVTQAYYEAFFREDIEVLYTIVCAEDKEWLDERIAEFDYLRPDLVSVDFADTLFELADSGSKWAVVGVTGSTTIYQGGSTYTYRWDEMAASDGYDYYTVYLQEIDGSWMICG
jgi:tetratricopeptide (TPR) repeat protein